VALEAGEPAGAPAPGSAPALGSAQATQDRFAPASRSRSASVSGRSGASRWVSALAAALILALLGTCGWLLNDLRERRDAIVRLAAQRDAALRHAGEVEARLGRLTTQVSSMRDSFSVMTSPAVEVCNLRAATPEQADARGMLFVAADHQHWAMSLRGLRPPAGGKVYQLWFVADQGPVSGGTFAAPPGAPVELGSDRMPTGTKAVRITLETSPGSPAPSGPDVLRNADTLHTL
jgi:HAMP domain-containing protein